MKHIAYDKTRKTHCPLDEKISSVRKKMLKWDDNRMMDNNDISVGFMLGVSISDPELRTAASGWSL